jgi:CRP-like cAMP-binding protein
LLDRARGLATCPLFGRLPAPVLIRLAERARGRELAPGDACGGDGVWVVTRGQLRVGDRIADVGHVLGVVRVIAPATPAVAAIAAIDSAVVELSADDVRDVLEEDPTALAALAEALAAQLLSTA